MKKFFPIIALLLIGVAIYFFFFNKPVENTYNYPERAFAVEDTFNISKIFIADKGDQEILLEKVKNKWYVNRKYIVRPSSIKILLETIKNLKVQYPVSRSAHNNVVRNLSAKGKKIEIYLNGDEQPTKVYYLGTTPIDNIGNYALVEGAKKPFVVNVPGFNGYISNRYILDIEQWRTRMVFNYSLDEIQQVNIFYPHFPEKSFLLTRDANNQFAILSDEDKTPRKVNPAVAVNYLQAFRVVGLETFANDFTRKDSLLNAKPFAIVSVRNDKDELNQLTVYYMPINKRSKSQITKEGKIKSYDEDRYYAILNTEKDVAVIQHYVFGKIFTTYQKLMRI